MDGHNSVMFSRKGDEWETPQKLFDLLNEEFHFGTDAAATSKNTKCGNYYEESSCNAMWIDWFRDAELSQVPPIFFLNPPYSKIGAFIKKAYEESLKGATIVCLIPARTDTRYFHDYCMKASELRFVKGRLTFTNKTLPSYRVDGNFKSSPAPFPSVIVVFERMQCQPKRVTVSSWDWKNEELP
jgi:site-specific DNA-methyltransferase (adenine-specific)